MQKEYAPMTQNEKLSMKHVQTEELGRFDFYVKLKQLEKQKGIPGTTRGLYQRRTEEFEE